MTTENTESSLATVPQKSTALELQVMPGFASAAGFDLMQRQAKLLASSALVPKEFQNNVANCTIALEMANRLNASPLAVLQNLYVVHGKPSWSSQFIIACINATGRYSPLRFEMSGEGDGLACIAWAIEKETGDRLESPPVSFDMAKKEGWVEKNGSKWKTMPQLMIRYRAATFFGRLYAPDVLMGMKSMEEVSDIGEPLQVEKPPLVLEVDLPATDKVAPQKVASESPPAEKPASKRAPKANIVDEFDALLAENGISEKAFMEFADANGLLVDGQLSSKTITGLVKDWDVTLAETKKFIAV